MNEYTKHVNDKIDDLKRDYYNENISERDIIDFINQIRSFSDALTFFLQKYTDYNGDPNNIDEKVNYIFQKYTSIGYGINKSVIKRWFTTAGPGYDDNSKEKIYALCFALGFDVSITKEFFKKAYFERCFDCHNYSEAVYYWCLKNQFDFNYAKEMISQISPYFESYNVDTGDIIYTNVIKQHLDDIPASSKEDLVSYLIMNKSLFVLRRVSAEKCFRNLIEDLQATKADADQLESMHGKLPYDISKCPIKALSVLDYYYGYEAANHIDVAGNYRDPSANSKDPDYPVSSIYSDEFLMGQIFRNWDSEARHI